MTTGTQILDRSLRMLGALRQGGTSSTDQRTGGLIALNSMLELLSVDRGFIYEIVDENFTWPSATASRTIGASGNFNTIWPTRIETAFVRDSNSIDYPLEITYERRIYDHVSDKSTQSTLPTILFLDRTYPLAVIFLRHVPSAALTLYISSWKRLQVFAAIGDTVSLPPGYEEAITVLLAETLWMEYPNPDVLPKLTQMAGMMRGKIKRINPIPMTMQTEVAMAVGGGGRYDINSDT